MRGDSMNKWEILGIKPTHDVKTIRKRYSELVKLYHPEDQPEIYQQIVEAYQSALREARSNSTRQETVGSEASSYQHFSNQEEKIVASPFNFETLSEEPTAHESNDSSHVLDFSDYLESEYLIRNAIESIVGNPDYTVEEQEHLWRQFFNQYRYDMSVVQSVLEEMDVYIFNKPEQFSIIIPLLEDYIPDFKYWGYYYKLKHWKVKRATAYKNGESLEDAKKETAKLYASYRLCQALLEDSQKANQIGVWITFFKQSFPPGTVLFLLNSSKQMITSIPVLAYILEKIKPEVGEEDQKAYDELVAYFEELKADSEEPFDIHSYNLLNSSEVEEALYLLAYSTYQDDARLVKDWSYLLENVQDESLLLQLLEDIDVYPFTNDKVLDIVFHFVEKHIKDEENPYLKKFGFWKDTHSYPWVVEKFSLDKKENFDYWYHQGYLYIDKITKNDEDINDWEKWRTYFKSKPRILAILLQQIYKEYHRFKDGELLLYVLGPFSTSKMVPMMMTEETDQKLEEMTSYAYQLCHPNSKISYLVWKKRQVFKNKFLQFVFGLFTIFSLIFSVLEQYAMNSWVHAGMVSLFYVYMLKLRQTLIEEGVAARGLKQKFYYNLKPWILLILLMIFILPTLPLGLIGALIFITFFCSIDGFKISEGFKWDYSLDKLVPLGLFLSSGFLVALANRSEMISYVAMCYIFIVMIVVGVLYFTRYKVGLPPSLKGIFFPILMGIIFFQLLPLTHSRLSLFNPVVLRDETLSLTFILLLNGIVLAYFTKEQRLAIGVKKTFMIYGLQIFIFLRRLFRILFAPIQDFSKVFFEKDLLIMNSEFAFYFLEGLFILILLLLVRNIRKENREVLELR